MNLLTIAEIIIAILLIVVIMLQSRGDSGGMAGAMAGGQSYRSKKGLEKFLFYATIALAVLFASVSIIAIIL